MPCANPTLGAAPVNDSSNATPVRRYVVHDHQVDHERLQHLPVPGRHRNLWDLVLLIAIHTPRSVVWV
jgi:hypothetical protein